MSQSDTDFISSLIIASIVCFFMAFICNSLYKESQVSLKSLNHELSSSQEDIIYVASKGGLDSVGIISSESSLDGSCYMVKANSSGQKEILAGESCKFNFEVTTGDTIYVKEVEDNSSVIFSLDTEDPDLYLYSYKKMQNTIVLFLFTVGTGLFLGACIVPLLINNVLNKEN